MQNSSEPKGDWLQIKGKLKQKLTDSDLLLLDGKQDELMGRLQERLGKTEAEMSKLISEL